MIAAEVRLHIAVQSLSAKQPNAHHVFVLSHAGRAVATPYVVPDVDVLYSGAWWRTNVT